VASTVIEYTPLVIAVTVALGGAGLHLRYFIGLYDHVIDKDTGHIGPPWVTVATAVNLIIARTILNLRSEASIWPADLALVQDRVSAHIDHRTIEHLQYAYRLEQTLRQLGRWRRAGRRYSMVAALIPLACLIASFCLGMKLELLWAYVLGGVISTILVHVVFLWVVDRHCSRAQNIHNSLRTRFE